MGGGSSKPKIPVLTFADKLRKLEIAVNLDETTVNVDYNHANF